ncbi:MAG: hypothetical protein KC668_09920 [Myxococcales bacterium]|nr:hypothetical protein [Myxococcales bacterium]
MRDLLLVELNELNLALLEEATSEFNLPNVRAALGWTRVDTLSADGPASTHLEPWTQWVSVHTGVPASAHGITELGEAPALQHPQLWERLGDHGITSGVWGVMNASRRAHPAVRFFVPDPWAFDERCHPAHLEHLIAPARAVAKRTGATGEPSAAMALPRLTVALHRLGLWRTVASAMPASMAGLFRHGPRALVFYAPYEFVSVHGFLRMMQLERPRFGVVFMNMLAHAQHYYWDEWERTRGGPMVECLHWLDGALGALLEASRDRDVLIYGALGQKPTAHEPPWVMYRHLSHTRLLSLAGVQPARVEPLMTHDAHLFYRSAVDAQSAHTALSQATVNGQQLFDVQPVPRDPTRLVYRVVFTGELDVDAASFSLSGRTHRFRDHFTRVVKRSGRHTPEATLLSKRPLGGHLPLLNHEVNTLILNHFGVAS